MCGRQVSDILRLTPAPPLTRKMIFVDIGTPSLSFEITCAIVDISGREAFLSLSLFPAALLGRGARSLGGIRSPRSEHNYYIGGELGGLGRVLGQSGGASWGDLVPRTIFKASVSRAVQGRPPTDHSLGDSISLEIGNYLV